MLIALFPSGAGISTIDENTETTFTGLLKGNGATIEQAVADEDYVTKQYVDEKAGSIEFATDEDVDTAKEYLTDAQPIWFTISLSRGTYENGTVTIKNVSGRTMNNVTCKWITNADVTNPNQWVDQADELPSLSKTYTDQYQLSEYLTFVENTSVTVYVLVDSVLVSTYSSEGYPSENDDAFFSYAKADLPELEDKSTLVKQVVELVDEALYEIVSKRYLRSDIDGCPIDLQHPVIKGDGEDHDEYAFVFGNKDEGQSSYKYSSGVRLNAHLNDASSDNNEGYIECTSESNKLELYPTSIRSRPIGGTYELEIGFYNGSFNKSSEIRFGYNYGESESPVLKNIKDPVDDHDVASKQYVDNLVKPTINTYTLMSSSWSNVNNVPTQTLSVNGISADEASQVVNVVPKTTDFKVYNDAGVYISKVAQDSLTFECSEKPSQNLTIYITIQKAIKGVVA